MPDERLTHLWIPADRVRVEQAGTGHGGEHFVRENLEDHSRSLLEAFQRSMDMFAGKHDLDLATDLFLEITTAPGRAVSAERQHLRNLGFEVISYSSDHPNTAIGRISRHDLPRLTKRLETYAGTPKHRGKGNLSAIDNLAPVAVERKLSIDLTAADREQPRPCLISLYATLSTEMKDRLATRIAEHLRVPGRGDVAIHRFTNGAVAISAALTSTEMALLGEQYMLVRSIESNTMTMSENGVQADPVPAILQVDRVKCQSPVAVVDSGINGACSLMDGLVIQTVIELPPGSVGAHLAHGTFVASRVVYGDDITAVLTRRASPWCPVIDIQVTGVDQLGNRILPTPANLGEILQRVVPLLAPHTKVFNISLGVDPARTGFYSSLARLLDYLSREHKVLFVVAAGNIDQPSAAPPAHYLMPDSRVLSPAEGLLVLSVGSVARYHEVGCVAREREIAPYSRRGPGADEGLKPELAANGGNALFDGLGWAMSPRTASYGLGRAGTHLEYAIGTSFASPLVAQYAARLFDAYQDATPNLVRALLCHFTRDVLVPSPGAPVEDHHFCGFGEPDIDKTLFTSPGSITYLYQGSLVKDMYTYIPFHVPQAMVADRRSRLTLRGTVIFDPPVSPDDSSRYSLCRVAGLLRKRTPHGLRAVTVGGDEDDVLYPWNPLLHFTHDFQHGYASGEWELRLRLMTRGALPDGFSQSVAVVVEVRDNSGRVDVRNATTTEFPGVYLPVALRIAA